MQLLFILTYFRNAVKAKLGEMMKGNHEGIIP